VRVAASIQKKEDSSGAVFLRVAPRISWKSFMKSRIVAGTAALVAVCFLVALAAALAAQKLNFKIPPVTTSVDIENQPVSITASGLISQVSAPRGENIFKLEMLADLSGLQQNITMILRGALNREDRCGDHIDIQHAVLTPQTPSSLVVSQLHFERWKCVKVLGKERPNKLIGGNGVIEVKLTPVVDEGHTLRLVPDVGRIEADGALGELLRSGSLGDQLREKIRDSLSQAMQKGTNFKATLPPAIQDYATIEKAQFRDAGTGNLNVVLDGRIRISDEQIKLLATQVKERAAEEKQAHAGTR
jgi:hypothetical protein